MTPAAAEVLGAVLRSDRARILAAVIARTGDVQLAEDALQDAAASALEHWARTGPPDRPTGWLIRVAFRKAIDRLRHARRGAATAGALSLLARDEAVPDPEAIPDERLRLIFACCHPALDPKSRVALTLRLICGLTTPEVARAFLDTDTAMGQRLSRAKARIGKARVPFAVPGPDDWDDRIGSVLDVIYLIFNAGHGGPAEAGDDPAPTRRSLCDEAIFLARLVQSLLPAEPEAMGLLSLLLSANARAPARLSSDGAFVPLSAQDRALWDGRAIAEATAWLDRALALQRPGRFQIEAAISALHVRAPSSETTDWAAIRDLYDRLLEETPTDVVRLNRAVAVAEAGDLPAALAEVEALSGNLSRYQPFHAVRGELLARAGQGAAARAAFAEAILLATAVSDRAYLARRRDGC